MKKLLSLALLALLAGCGSDLFGETCQSGGAAKAQVSSDTCTLAPGNATIRVTLCSDCLAASASCVAEFVNGSLELAPTYCVDTSGSSSCQTTNGCNAAVRQADCPVTIPSTGDSTRAMTIVSADNVLIPATLHISSSGGSSCTL